MNYCSYKKDNSQDRYGERVSLYTFTYGGYATGKKKLNEELKEMEEDLEKKLDEDFPDDEFYDEDEDDFLDEDYYEPYFRSAFNFPVVNIRKGITEDNFGYAQGVTQNGVPFATEIYDRDDSEFLVVYIPAFIRFPEKHDTYKKIKKDLKQTTDKADALDIGMFDAGEETDKNELIRHFNFLIANELVITVSADFKVAVSYRIDKNGTKLAKVTVNLLTMMDSTR